MKINNKFFSLPPYISTPWSNVETLHMKGSSLIVNLNDGNKVEIPGLDAAALENIFNVHAHFMEQHESNPEAFTDNTPGAITFPVSQMLMNIPGEHASTRIDIPLHLGSGAFEELGSALQHNPAQSSAPDLPHEILHKIVAITKIIAPEEATMMLPQPQENCNCIHCQIARTMHEAMSNDEPHAHVHHTPAEEDNVSEQDLQFQQWDISQTGDKMFTVINRLDSKERYSVYLGHPVGCTCGKEGCEHIVAVLKS